MIADRNDLPKPLPVTFWLAPSIARDMVVSDRIASFGHWLVDHGLTLRGLDGDRYTSDHQIKPRHAVYHPDWRHRDRFNYTCDLVAVLNRLLPEGETGSITTLPIGWQPDMPGGSVDARFAAQQVNTLVHYLARAELDSGRFIHVDFLPRCGCLMHDCNSVVDFYDSILRDNPDELSLLSYLRIAWDAGTAAVQFEQPQNTFHTLRNKGIRLGRLLCTYAIEISLDQHDAGRIRPFLPALKQIDDDRIPHAASLKQADGKVSLKYNISELLEALEHAVPDTICRIGFAADARSDRHPLLRNTRTELSASLHAIRPDDDITFFEIRNGDGRILDELYGREDQGRLLADELAWIKHRMSEIMI